MEEVMHIEEEQVSAEVRLMVGSIEEKLNKMPSNLPDCSIYRVPETLVKERPEAYIPHKVSIGPFHHDQQHLQHMEARKMHYFNKFLCRRSPRLENYIKAVTDLVEKTYQCYPEVEIERKSFVMMMVLDGCFILELLLWEYGTISNLKWSTLVLLDLLLLGNQLPFFVLEALYQAFIKHSHEASDTCTLSGVICKYFVPLILGFLLGKKDTINSSRDIEQIKPIHLLDLVRQFLIPATQTMTDSEKKKQISVGNGTQCLHSAPTCVCRLCLGDPLDKDNLIVGICCATELEKAGVKLKKNKNPTSLLDIKFDIANGVLTIPGIQLHCGTESILRNLIAFEQHTDDYSYITEYAAFLDGLIDSSKDVELLQKNGIIETIVGDPNEVARLFSNLLRDVAIPFHYTIPVRCAVEQYYNIPWHKWKASLMLNYFNTPWSIFSVVAAIVLLALTFTQTFYAALPCIK